ncbi:MAG TPA: polysaccharide pyruvyl transferase family protein [Vicinamibacterales bacterium]|nr:polysaccharide pyruvyl transferase family protein [Vicinamibacterales bacterium]
MRTHPAPPLTIFLVRPTTRNIGNDLIAFAVSQLLYEAFGDDANIVGVPALVGPQFGGLVPRQVYDMNRLADAVVIGGGNLLENGQLSYDARAVDALRPPLALLALSHGRIAARGADLQPRSDALRPETIQHLVRKSSVALVRDGASQQLLREMGVTVEVGGCPTLFLPPNAPDQPADGGIIISVRHPLRMSVPPPLQWRVADDLRRLIATLRAEFDEPVRLSCHDYIDLEFAAGFPEATPVYFDDVGRYMAALRRCRLHVSYRLHGFLPCLAFGSHSIHLSYDERGRSMLSTLGLEAGEVDLLTEPDCVAAVMDRARSRDRYFAARHQALPVIAELHRITRRSLDTMRLQLRGAASGAMVPS